MKKKRPAKASLIKGQIGTHFGTKRPFLANCPGTLWDTSGHLPAIAGFLEVLALQCKFVLCVRMDNFGLTIIADIGKDDVALCLERHDSAACIGFAGGKIDGFSDVLLGDIFGEARREERAFLPVLLKAIPLLDLLTRSDNDDGGTGTRDLFDYLC